METLKKNLLEHLELSLVERDVSGLMEALDSQADSVADSLEHFLKFFLLLSLSLSLQSELKYTDLLSCNQPLPVPGRCSERGSVTPLGLRGERVFRFLR